MWITRESEKENMRYQYKVWQRSTATCLGDVYGRFSHNKNIAMKRCVDLMMSLHGRRLRILSHNSFSFTVGFEFPHPETGGLCFAYITPSYDRFIEL